MHDLIIIGAGPAGLTAALYAGRYRLDTVALERVCPGGQIILSPTIENYPGFPGGISTQELIGRFQKQAEEAGISFVSDEALSISADESGKFPVYKIETAGKSSHEAKTVIISSGAQSKRLGVKGEDNFVGRGVSYCAACDAPLFKNKDVFVVGGGDRAIEEAIYLASYANSVTLIHRRQEFRASKILQERAKAIPKIKFMLDSVIEEIKGNAAVESITVKDVKTGDISEKPCRGIFVFVGIIPNTAYLKNFLRTDGSGFIITGQDLSASRAGIFACGDCRQKGLYQVVNACGDGAQAAASAHKYLLNLK